MDLALNNLQRFIYHKTQASKQPNQSDLLSTYSRRENSWIHPFLKSISALRNANSLVKDLISGGHVHCLLAN